MKSVQNICEKVKSRFCAPPVSSEGKARISLDYKILVGTHHKTGTVWMASIFKQLCNELGLVYYGGLEENIPATFDVWFEDHSRFGEHMMNDGWRGLHIIRDPRDVIVSACFYHQKSSEPQLHVPKKEFRGMTYQEKLCSFPTVDDQLLFSMENSAGSTVRDIVSWDYRQSNFLNVKYEDLMTDVDLLLFHRIFTFLGFPGEAIPCALQSAYDNSLFSGKVSTGHIRSGKSQQWRSYFKPVHKSRFQELFGDALVKLGYEDNNNWTCAEYRDV